MKGTDPPVKFLCDCGRVFGLGVTHCVGVVAGSIGNICWEKPCKLLATSEKKIGMLLCWLL
jgi:hypothetical protein